MNKQTSKEIYEIISKLKTPQESEEFLKAILTESELSDIFQRWNIFKMLTKKETQRNIAKELSASLCKITRGAKILKNEKSIIKQILSNERWRK